MDETQSPDKLPAVKRSAQIRKELGEVMAAVASSERILPVFFKNPLYKPKLPADAGKKRIIESDNIKFGGRGALRGAL